jgi:hypothetical protein
MSLVLLFKGAGASPSASVSASVSSSKSASVSASLSANEKEMWASYRQLLKDIPQTYSNTVDVVYPKKPKELK